ncbi:MAG: hypothetical protein MJE66_19395 [Proteobacteria bacterium]|nr:hypothetical protein [Pseudomonadota bacterium]
MRFRLSLIILGSAFFYGWWGVAPLLLPLVRGASVEDPLSLALAVLTQGQLWVPLLLIVIAFYGARIVMSRPDARGRKLALAWVVTVALIPLAGFKYANFLYADVLGPVLGLEGRLLQVQLPLGISFITFSLLAYVVDVYRGRFPLQPRLSLFASYILFFPHLIAGPILRPHELIPQLERSKRRLSNRSRLGLCIFTLGLVKKLVFADPLSEHVVPVYAGAEGLTGPDYLLAIYAFSIRIYCDFSGYTDMAIGLALVLGLRLPTNFRRPYGAASIQEFWRRWHITLSNWLRDYLYIPLGGNRVGPGRRVTNVLITMGLGGLWHGAAWTFVLWGLLHGAAIALSQRLDRRAAAGRRRLPRWLRVALCFHVVTLGWVLFRAPDLATVGRVLAGPFVAPWSEVGGFLVIHAFPLVLIALLLAFHPFDSHARMRLWVRRVPAAVLYPVLSLFWILAITVSAGSSAEFIYFDF